MTQLSYSFDHPRLIKLLTKIIKEADALCKKEKLPQTDHKKDEVDSQPAGSEEFKKAYTKREQSFKDTSLKILGAMSYAINIQEVGGHYSEKANKILIELFKVNMQENTLKDVFKYIYFMSKNTDLDEPKLYSICDLFLTDGENLLASLEMIDILYKYHVELLLNPMIQHFDVSRRAAKDFLNNPIEFFYMLHNYPSIINKQDGHRKTLLHYFAKEKYHKNLTIILHLLFNQNNLSIDLTLKDLRGNTAIHSFLLCYLQKKSLDQSDLDKYQEVLNVLLEGALKKSFNFSLKNHEDISVIQLMFVFKTKILFDIDHVKKTINNHNHKKTILTEKLFSSPTLNPINILKGYDDVILEKRDSTTVEEEKNKYHKVHMEVEKLIHALESIRNHKSIPQKLYSFFSIKESARAPEEKVSQRYLYM